MANHLDEDGFDAALMRRLVGTDDVAATDDADVTAMAEALGSYRAQTLDWAERKSAAMPSPLPVGARQPGPAWLQSPQWVLGTVAFCACVMGGALYTHHQATLLDQAAVALPLAPTAQTLAADNQLLSSVDDALQSAVAPDERQLGLTNDAPGESAPTRRYAGQRSN